MAGTKRGEVWGVEGRPDLPYPTPVESGHIYVFANQELPTEPERPGLPLGFIS